jgi:hypothetical protein
MKSTRIEELEQAVDRRILTEAEASEVLEELRTSSSPHQKYRMLHILWHGADSRLAHAVEPFLTCTNEVPLVWIALATLCGQWGLTGRYREHVLTFLRGVPWDKDNQIRLLAVTLSGKYLSDNQDSDLVRALIDVVERNEEYRDRVLRHSALVALGLAVGFDESEIPGVKRLLSPGNSMKLRIMEMASCLTPRKAVDADRH